MSGARAVGLSYARFLAAATPTGGQAPGELVRIVMFAPKWCPCPCRPRLYLATGRPSQVRQSEVCDTVSVVTEEHSTLVRAFS